MPPHCDSMDGPVVTAARQALDAGDVTLVLPYVHEDGESEIRAMFDLVQPLHDATPAAREIAERLFFETVVRVHRAGEHAAYTGLKPSGLDVGPVIPLAEQAIAEGSSGELSDFLAETLRTQLAQRLDDIKVLAQTKDDSLAQARRYVEAVLGFQVFSHHLYKAMLATTSH